ncbi:MAG TPA: hypothetical protein VHW44_11255 [Pseudonocardiaceae bacterium]|nr:hypothetical protein [Pseudonocardiaceae bacterium]
MLHHSSHRHLLAAVPRGLAGAETVDAIVVPTARPAVYLRPVITLAAALGATLVTLCSKDASAHRTAAFARDAGVELIAVDTKKLPRGLLPRFDTTEMLRDTRLERWADTSAKRNLGLLLGRLMGWQRIVFLDDDIAVPRPEDLNDAVRLLDTYDGVGLAIGGHPDNSVVCHANRESGGAQDTFIGGGALAVDPSAISSFFPNVYNEDWFFLLDNVRLRPTAVTGTALQQPYDPFANDKRARSEEFGDCMAEGVFWLLDGGLRVQDATEAHWREFLKRRLAFINEILARVGKSEIEPGNKRRMIESLKAARGRCQIIEPELCVRYLKAWLADSDVWRRHLDEWQRQLGTGLTAEKMLVELGLKATSVYLPGKRAPLPVA